MITHPECKLTCQPYISIVTFCQNTSSKQKQEIKFSSFFGVLVT